MIASKPSAIGRALSLSWTESIGPLGVSSYVISRSTTTDGPYSEITSVVGSAFHRYAPQGVTGVLLIAESHLSVHTWPEHGYLGADIFFCGEGNPETAIEKLVELFQARDVKVRRLNRGIQPQVEADDLLIDASELA